ncbi:MAG: AmmeMemoRadiSam system radical SAM enzyme [Desulfobulbales bacterium]|nr:AmmeMemoRadiSam system radical SAM enzyme [Desulfobulbales bacterium]
MLHEAMFYRRSERDENAVQCFLCNHHCRIKEGRRGLCRVRENRGGTLYSLVYGRLITENVDPIEKKPLFHLLPGSYSYSIATVGCNFHCRHCQNYDISQYPSLHDNEIIGNHRTPLEVVESAGQLGCASISYTYVEPTIFFEFALDTARLAAERGLKNVFVSNGYTTPEATRAIAPFLDGNNIDLKAFTDKFYREVCGARLQPVLDTITLMKELGVWVEVTTLIIPGWNDSEAELKEIANFIKSLDPDIPWHVTRFQPTYKMIDRPVTPTSSIKKAREIGLAAGLKHVYTGNLLDPEGESTYCPNCRERLITRTGFSSEIVNLKKGACRNCHTALAGVFDLNT